MNEYREAQSRMNGVVERSTIKDECATAMIKMNEYREAQSRMNGVVERSTIKDECATAMINNI